MITILAEPKAHFARDLKDRTMKERAEDSKESNTNNDQVITYKRIRTRPKLDPSEKQSELCCCDSNCETLMAKCCKSKSDGYGGSGNWNAKI